MGSPDFAIPTLIALSKTCYRPILCVTMPDKKKGRGKKMLPTPIKVQAQKLGIEVFSPENINKEIEFLKKYNPDIIVVVGFGAYIQKNLRKLPKHYCINLHPSLLPKYRGSSPIRYALLDGVPVTGCTIFRIAKKMDAGPIILQSKLEISKDENFSSLHDRLAQKGAEDIVKALDMIFENKVKLQKQDENAATFTEKISKKKTHLLWQNSSEMLCNFIRAFSLSPGATTQIKGKRLKIIQSKILDEKSKKSAGTIVEIIKNIGFVVASQNKNILIEKVQPAGKKIMPAYDYILGARIGEGDIFESIS